MWNRDLRSGSTKGLEDYHEILSKMISTLDIHKAVVEKKVQADVTSSRVLEKAPKIMLLLADSQKKIINRVWEKDNSSLAVFKQSLTERYYIIESDFEKFCKMGSLDKIFSHTLRCIQHLQKGKWRRSQTPAVPSWNKKPGNKNDKLLRCFECKVPKPSSLVATIPMV